MTFTTHTNSPAKMKDSSGYKPQSMIGRRYNILKERGFTTNKIIFIGSSINTKIDLQKQAILVPFPGRSENTEDFYFEVNSKIICFNTTNDALKGLMVHANGIDGATSAKSNTHNTTYMKELISKEIFKHPCMTETEVVGMVEKEHNHLLSLYDTNYYSSALSQLESFKTLKINTSDYIFELQMGEVNEMFYNRAKQLSKLHKDNWNPADLWVIKKTALLKIESMISKATSIDALNICMQKLVKDKYIYPISLKHISNGQSKIVLCNMGEEYTSEYSFGIEKFNIAESFKSIFVITDSDYQFKLNMRASADCINLNKEGKIKNKNASEGALPSNLWNYFITKNPPISLSNGATTPILTKELYKEKLNIFVKYKEMISNDIHLIQFEDLDEITGKRYQIIADHIEYIMTYQEVVEFSYFASKKLYKGAAPFYLISE